MQRNPLLKPTDHLRTLKLHSTLLLLLLSTSSGGWAGEKTWEQSPFLKRIYHFKHITTDGGLSNNDTRTIIQDKRGFIWIGTVGGGLNRYDGASVRVFTHDPQDSNSIGSNTVYTLFEDISGLIWIGTTADGLSIFDPTTERVRHFRNIPRDSSSISDNWVRTICQDGTGTIWIGTQQGGLNRVVLTGRDTSGGSPLNAMIDHVTFRRYVHSADDPKSISPGAVFTICEDHKGNLWIGTNNGLDLLDGTSNGFIHFRHDPLDAHSLSSNSVMTVYEDRLYNLWVGTIHTGLDLFVSSTNRFVNYRHDPRDEATYCCNTAAPICEDSVGNLWVGRDIMDRQKGTFTHFQHEKDNPYGLSHNNVWDYCVDRSGIMWIPTLGGGVNMLVPRTEIFKHYRLKGTDWDAEGKYKIYDDEDGNLWIGTNLGLSRIDGGDGLRHHPYDQDVLKSWSMNDVTCFLEDSEGRFWVGTLTGGLKLFDKTKGRFRDYLWDSAGSTRRYSNRVNTVYEDRYGKIWVGTHEGIMAFDPGLGTFNRYSFNPSVLGSLTHDYVTSIVEDVNGTMWIGTEGGGLNRVIWDSGGGPNRRPKEFAGYRHDPNDRNSILNDMVYAVLVFDERTIWVGTAAGLCKLDVKAETFRGFPKMGSNFVSSLALDKAGFVWLACPDGIARFNAQTEQFHYFDRSDGLPTAKYTSVNKLRLLRDGRMAFSGTKGFVLFHPDSVRIDTSEYPLIITSMSIANKPVRFGRSISSLNAISLSHDQNFFSFTFAALAYGASERVRYAYKLDGFEGDWTSPVGTNDARYTGVPPGRYTLKVKATNGDGIWNQSERVLLLVITPPWWKSSWAYTAYGLVIVVFLLSVRRFEKNRELLRHQLELRRVEAEKLREVDQMKSRFFANISHEFRTPLTLLLGPIDYLQSGVQTDRSKETLSMMKRSAQRLLGLVNELLDLSKLDAGKMKLRCAPVNLVEFVRRVVSLFESAATRTRLTLNLTTDREEIEVYCDTDKLERVLVNLVSNALKFTPPGGEVTVIVRVPVSNNSVEISVKDTGVGIPPEELPLVFERFHQVDGSQARETMGTGIGLALTKELVEFHRGAIHVSSELGRGSEFIVRLPLGRDHLKEDEILPRPEQLPVELRPPDQAVSHEPTKRVPDLMDGADDKPVVLVVDDNPDVRAYIQSFLSGEFDVVQAEDGTEGIEMAIRSTPDLIISDVMMPKTNGYDLCRRLKHDERTSHIPIILLTARASGEDRVEGLQAQADDYVVKPFEAGELVARVRNLIQVRRRLHERFKGGLTFRPEEIAMNTVDSSFLKRVREVVEGSIANEDFGVQELADQLHLSRSQLHRKLTALLNLGPADFIRYIRVHRGRELLLQNAGNVSQVAFSVGFSSPAYFAKCFREQFGQSPSDLKDTHLS